MKENLDGKTVGIFTILYQCKKLYIDGHKQYCVKCNYCGKIFFRKMSDIKRTKYCRHNVVCWGNDRIGKIFNGICHRCYNPKNKSYRWYGDKGIKVCDEWLQNPKSFEDWALNNGYKNNLTIDRIDSNKDYCPGNCQWITLEENSRKVGAHFIKIGEEMLSEKQWSYRLNLGHTTISKLSKKYPEEKVKEFIRRRLENPNLERKSKQTWMNVYGLE